MLQTSVRSTPVLRSRICERIAQAAKQPVTLIVAAAGFGKTVALRHYLATLDSRHVRFDVAPFESSLLGFVRGLAAALHPVAPDLRKTVSHAYEQSRLSQKPVTELALWMNAHIQDFNGVVAIDDLHLTQGSAEVCEFLATIVGLTKRHIRWVISSRSVLSLPIASWMAYGDADGIIDQRDLLLTEAEAREIGACEAPDVGSEELQELISMTQGWAAALSFALRSAVRSRDLREVKAHTRELLYSYLAEQVYASLDPCERELLHFAAYLPEIDVELLCDAGFAAARATLERLCNRTALLQPNGEGVYSCQTLFRDFVQRQLELCGSDSVTTVQRKVAGALKAAGKTVAALRLYVQMKSEDEVVAILNETGLELWDCGHADLINEALDVCSVHSRETLPILLALRSSKASQHGRFMMAESLLRRAIGCAGTLAQEVKFRLKLATLFFNQMRYEDDVEILEDLLRRDLAPHLRAPVAALIAVAYAYLGRNADAEVAIRSAEDTVTFITNDHAQARAIYRIAAARSLLGISVDIATARFRYAADLALRTGLYTLASAALGSLSNAVYLYEDDIDTAAEYAERAMDAATKAGDHFTRQSESLRLCELELQRGNFERLCAIAGRVRASHTGDPGQGRNLATHAAHIAAWNRDFSRAHDLLTNASGASWLSMDRALNAAMHSVYALAAGRREDALALCDRAIADAEKVEMHYVRAQRVGEISRLICAVTQALAGRSAQARRIIGLQRRLRSAATDAMRDVAISVCDAMSAPLHWPKVWENLGALKAAGYAGVAAILERAIPHCVQESRPDQLLLTQAELNVLRALDEGMTPKDIAAQTGRSIHTARTLIQRAVTKLGCSGRQQALAAARSRGLL